MLCYTMLCYTILYYTILYYTILYYTILYYTIPHYTMINSHIQYYTTFYPRAAPFAKEDLNTTLVIGKDRDPLIRDPLCLSLLSLLKAILSLTKSCISLLSLLELYFRGSLSGGPYLSLCSIQH